MNNDYSLTGKSLYRANYKVRNAEMVSTRLFICDSFQDVYNVMIEYHADVESIELIEDDISLGVIRKEQIE